MRTTLVAALALTLAACGSDSPTGPAKVVPPNLAGAATMTITNLTVNIGGTPLVCNGTVPMTVTVVNDSAFTGRFSAGDVGCWRGAEDLGLLDLSASITGTRHGNALSFTDGYCTYLGTLTTSGVADGTIVCPDAGFTWRGAWSMGAPR